MKLLTENGGHARQGDVLIRRNDHAATPLKRVPPVLARGEVTGHHHSYGGGAVAFADHEDGLAQVVEIDIPEPLTHQEHAPIPTPPGRYEVLVQVEDTSQEITRVAD
jgi:hypothetical protein